MRVLPILIASAFCMAAMSSAVQAEKQQRRTTHKAPPPASTEDDAPANVVTTPAAKTPAPTPAATTPGPAVTPAAAAVVASTAEINGRRAYLKFNCYGCHGMGAAGGMGPNIVRAEAGDVSEAVMQGEEGGMPSYRRIATANDVTNLAAYLRSIGTAREPKFNDWWVATPTK